MGGLSGILVVMLGHIGPILGVLTFVVIGAFWTTVFTHAPNDEARQ